MAGRAWELTTRAMLSTLTLVRANPLSGLVAEVRAGVEAALRFRYPPAGRGYGLLDWPVPGARFNYTKEAGDLWSNSAVGCCLNFVLNTFPEAELVVESRRQDGKWVPIHGHSLVNFMQAPNPFIDGLTLWNPTVISLVCDGNAYWYKARNELGELVELHYLPHFAVQPIRERGSGRLVDYYEYTLTDGNQREIFPAEDIVHLRNGLDPRNTTKGLSRLAADLREIVTDNEASTFSAAMLRNKGFTGAIIRPKEGVAKGITEEKALEYKAKYNAEFVGEGRGGVLVMSGAFEIERPPGFSPEELTLDKVRRVPESRIAGSIGIPAVVAGLAIGLETTSAKSSYRESVQQAWEGCLIPLKRQMASQLQMQLLPEFLSARSPRNIRVGWDYTNVPALQENQTDRARRAVILYKGGVGDRAECRDIADLEVRDTDKDVWFPGTDPASEAQLTSPDGGDVNNPSATAPAPDSTTGTGDESQNETVGAKSNGHRHLTESELREYAGSN